HRPNRRLIRSQVGGSWLATLPGSRIRYNGRGKSWSSHSRRMVTMKNSAVLILVGIFAGCSFAFDPPAAETPAKDRIVAVGLFKNGLAVGRREVALPGPGTYRLDQVPEPIHGTFWVDCAVPVVATVRFREIEEPATPFTGQLQENLAGKAVRL